MLVVVHGKCTAACFAVCLERFVGVGPAFGRQSIAGACWLFMLPGWGQKNTWLTIPCGVQTAIVTSTQYKYGFLNGTAKVTPWTVYTLDPRVPIRPYQVTLDETFLWLPSRHDNDWWLHPGSRPAVPRGRPIKGYVALKEVI